MNCVSPRIFPGSFHTDLAAGNPQKALLQCFFRSRINFFRMSLFASSFEVRLSSSGEYVDAGTL